MTGLQPPGVRQTRFELDGCEYVVVGLDVAAACQAGLEGLTGAEAEVLALVVQGLTSRAIAALRRRSVHTVDNQITTIFRKLGVASRAELATRIGPPVSA